jgi:hypothetical protein
MEQSESLDHIPHWPIIEDARQLEGWINAASNQTARHRRAMEVIGDLDDSWPHHGEFFRIIGVCRVPEEPFNPYSFEWAQDEEVAGLSLGFEALPDENDQAEIGLVFRTHGVNINGVQKQGELYAQSFVSLRNPFTVVEHESDQISALTPERLISQQPDEHFSFRRYNAIGHRFIYDRSTVAHEERKRKALDYIRQRWPYGECDLSISAEYAYQLNWGELFFVHNMHLFSSRQPIRGTLLDFGFYPHRITSNGALLRRTTKFGIETLSLVIEPDDPEQFFLRPDSVLVVPTSQRLSAVVHEEDQDIVIK